MSYLTLAKYMRNEIDSMNKNVFWNNNMEENTDKRVVHFIAWARYVRHNVKGARDHKN